MDTVNVERSYGDVDDYHPSRNSVGIGVEPSTLISILAFLAFLLHALLILLIPTLKTFFARPLFDYGYNNGIGLGGGGFGPGVSGGSPGIGGGYGTGGFGTGGFGGGGFGTGGFGGGFGGYGAVPAILSGVNGILGTGLLGTTNLLGTGLTGLIGPAVAGIGTGTPITTVTHVRMLQSDDKRDIKPATEAIGDSAGRNINANKLLSKCNFYFCLPEKIKLDRLSIGMTRTKIKRK